MKKIYLLTLMSLTIASVTAQITINNNEYPVNNSGFSYASFEKDTITKYLNFSTQTGNQNVDFSNFKITSSRGYSFLEYKNITDFPFNDFSLTTNEFGDVNFYTRGFEEVEFKDEQINRLYKKTADSLIYKGFFNFYLGYKPSIKLEYNFPINLGWSNKSETNYEIVSDPLSTDPFRTTYNKSYVFDTIDAYGQITLHGNLVLNYLRKYSIIIDKDSILDSTPSDPILKILDTTYYNIDTTYEYTWIVENYGEVAHLSGHPNSNWAYFNMLNNNDDCSGASNISTNSYSFTPNYTKLISLKNATESKPSCVVSNTSPANDKWFYFKGAEDDSLISLTLRPYSNLVDIAVEQFDGCNGNSIQCVNSNSTPGSTEQIIINVAQEEGFYFRVYALNSTNLVDTNAYVDIKIDEATSIVNSISQSKTSLHSVELYPNPSSNIVNLNFITENAGNVSYTLVDLTGKAVKSIALGNRAAGNYTEQMDVKDLAKGTYLLNLVIGEQIVRKKISVM